MASRKLSARDRYWLRRLNAARRAPDAFDALIKALKTCERQRVRAKQHGARGAGKSGVAKPDSTPTYRARTEQGHTVARRKRTASDLRAWRRMKAAMRVPGKLDELAAALESLVARTNRKAGRAPASKEH